jgi:hypothetical protein
MAGSFVDMINGTEGFEFLPQHWRLTRIFTEDMGETPMLRIFQSHQLPQLSARRRFCDR